MKRIKRNQVSMDDVRQMLLSGARLKLVSAATGYSVPELSIMCRCWEIKRKRGPRAKVSE